MSHLQRACCGIQKPACYCKNCSGTAVIQKIIPATAHEMSNERWSLKKTDQWKERKPERISDAAFGTSFRIRKCFHINNYNLYNWRMLRKYWFNFRDLYTKPSSDDPIPFIIRSLDTLLCFSLRHRLNMQLDLQSLYRLHVHSCTHWPWSLVSQDRRHPSLWSPG
jgi:hypothetical protein